MRVADVDFHTDAARSSNISSYFRMCKELSGLHVTTSCFTTWKQSGRLNGSAKLIPAIRVNSSASGNLRVFFFDDNVEFEGREQSSGICNLRDVETGNFVEFGLNCNGFTQDVAGSHTVIHHSSMYRNIIVKANLLDAMEDTNYFTNIIRAFSHPGEKIIVFMDVNSTILCSDTSAGKDTHSALLSSIFELMIAKPRGDVEFAWQDRSPVRLQKTRSLKQIVKDIVGSDKRSYSDFWKEETCLQFLDELSHRADISWASRAGCVTCSKFSDLLRSCSRNVSTDASNGCIASSWFQLVASMNSSKTALILNSFGVDTRKVVDATVCADNDCTQIVVNYDLWDERDKQAFENQYNDRQIKMCGIEDLLVHEEQQCMVGCTHSALEFQKIFSFLVPLMFPDVHRGCDSKHFLVHL
eukprot:TRINITY_DN8263_c0_g3_i1.p1 TRINITY_DN8263_c0_g3~~TRINITY_DN8263_c0_g3_i1.p1  ORF type:complete len:436 (-),score=78.39 TRINITY_DN8263_c0_g3_i1:333-1568(-)